MNFFEKNLEDIIYEASKTEKGRRILCERGLELHGKTYRQVNLGERGIADLINISTDGRKGSRLLLLNLIELKRHIIDIKALVQATTYYTALFDIFKGSKELLGIERYTWTVMPSIILIGESIDKNVEKLLPILSMVELYTYNYEIDGIRFKRYKDNLVVSGDILPQLMYNVCHPTFHELKEIMLP